MIIPPVPPPVHVIVDQVPITPGVPEWIRLLITGLSGLVIGLLMEYAKPLVAKRRLRKTMAALLKKEFVRNWAIVLAGIQILEDAVKKPEKEQRLVKLMPPLCAGIKNDRFEYYFAQFSMRSMRNTHFRISTICR